MGHLRSLQKTRSSQMGTRTDRLKQAWRLTELVLLYLSDQAGPQCHCQISQYNKYDQRVLLHDTSHSHILADNYINVVDMCERKHFKSKIQLLALVYRKSRAL